MMYVVEMEFRNAAREHDWHVWYICHTAKLVRNVPGFTGTQRFRCLTPTRSPWIALHEVAGPEVFESAAYQANGGPASTGEWQTEHTNWDRNVFDGIKETPDVGFDEHVLMGEGDAKLPGAFAGKATVLTSVGLDRTSPRRTIAVVPKGQLTASMFDVPGVRILKPITPKLRT